MALGIVSVGAVGCAQTTAGEPADELTGGPRTVSGSLDDQVEQIVGVLDCDHSYRDFDDLYNFSPMRGLSCVTPDGDVLVVRVYETRRASDLALQDWPLAGVGRYIVRGDQWFTVGPLEDVKPLSAEISGASPASQDPAARVVPTPKEQSQSSCTRFLTNALTDFVVNPDQYETERADFESIYPGLPHVVEGGLGDRRQIEQLRSEVGDELQFESRLSHVQSPLKAFCASAPAR